MRVSILRLEHEYVTELLLKIVRLITETINGGNKYLAIRYARIGVFDYSMEILKYGFSDEEVKSLDKFNSKIELKQGKSNKNNQLKQEVLRMMNLLLIPETEDQFRSQENKDFINILMALNYFELKIRKGNSYTSDLFKPNSKVSKVYNINIGFQ